MVKFKQFLLIEAGVATPANMKKTFDDYFKHTNGHVEYDSKDKNRLNFHATKSTCKEIIAMLDSILGFSKNKLFTTSPIVLDSDSKKFFHFSITFKSI
jgi:hypothetical protein